jgi:hypothetical protein
MSGHDPFLDSDLREAFSRAAGSWEPSTAPSQAAVRSIRRIRGRRVRLGTLTSAVTLLVAGSVALIFGTGVVGSTHSAPLQAVNRPPSVSHSAGANSSAPAKPAPVPLCVQVAVAGHELSGCPGSFQQGDLSRGPQAASAAPLSTADVFPSVGETVEVTLPRIDTATEQWGIASTNPDVLAPSGVVERTATGLVQQRFVAKAPGDASIAAVRRPVCRSGGACPQFMVLAWTLNVIVNPTTNG